MVSHAKLRKGAPRGRIGEVNSSPSPTSAYLSARPQFYALLFGIFSRSTAAFSRAVGCFETETMQNEALFPGRTEQTHHANELGQQVPGKSPSLRATSTNPRA